LRILVTGAGGQLGTDVVRLAGEAAQHEVIAADHARLDVGDRDAVLGAVLSLAPDLVVHTAAWTAVDACEADPERAYRINAMACRHVAEAARRAGSHLVAVSTDYVFDGASEEPYREWDPPNPLSVYGSSKLAGEKEAFLGCPGATVVRTSWVCGANGSNIVKTVLALAASGKPMRFVDDQRGCPTFTPDLAQMLLRLGVGRVPGLFHVTNQGATTWYRFACDILAAAGKDPGVVEPITTAELDPPRPARRPPNSVLDNSALRASGIPLLPDHHEALERTMKLLVG
jgi:dTDP-4-dehydrorhamnose reductase